MRAILDEIGGALGTHIRDEKCIQKFWSKILKERDILGDHGIGRRIILK
jgi:hypothetical protein